MTLYEFRALEIKDQAEAVWSLGMHLESWEDESYTTLLYQIEGFYVEVYYSKDFNAILVFHSYPDTECLTPYLYKINIDLENEQH